MKYILDEKEIETIKIALMEMIAKIKKENEKGFEIKDYLKYKEALKALNVCERYNKDIENK